MKAQEDIERKIVQLLCKYNEQAFDISLKDQPLVNSRLDSVNAVAIVDELEEDLEVELFPTLFWEFSTISEMAEWISKQS